MIIAQFYSPFVDMRRLFLVRLRQFEESVALVLF